MGAYQTDYVLPFSPGLSSRGLPPQTEAATFPERRRSHPPEQPKLVLRCVVKLFLSVHHVLMRLLDGIEFRLLICRQDWPNLRHSALNHGFHFLHRLLVNGSDLGFGRVEDGLNLRLLFGGKVQLIGELVKAKCVPVRARGPRVSLGLGDNKAAQRDRAGSHNC